MIFRDGDVQLVVAKLQREFATTHKIFVLPPAGIGVRAHSREPLGQFVQASSIVQNFVSTA